MCKWQKGSWKLRTREGIHDFPWLRGSRKHLCPIQALCCVPVLWVHTHSVIFGSRSKNGVFSSVTFHLWAVSRGCQFLLVTNERVFSDVPLEAVSFLAMVNSGFALTSAYSVSIEQPHVCRFLNLELWSEWCNYEGEAEGTTTKKISYFGFVMELWSFFLISNFVKIKCLLNHVCV